MGNTSFVWAGWHLHMFFGLAAIVGFILLAVWAWKELKGKELKKWALVILAVGVLGSLLTANFGKQGWDSMWEGKGKTGKNQNPVMMQGNPIANPAMMQGVQPGTNNQVTKVQPTK